MVNYNFPALEKYLRRYNDAPYQVVVEVDHKEKVNPHDFTSEPTIQYYYIASSTNEIPHPMIQEVEEKAFSDHEQIMQDIQESYAKQGRSGYRLQWQVLHLSLYQGEQVKTTLYPIMCMIR